MNQAQERSSIIFPEAYWSHKLALLPWEGTTRCESWEAGTTREAGWHPGKAPQLYRVSTASHHPPLTLGVPICPRPQGPFTPEACSQ